MFGPYFFHKQPWKGVFIAYQVTSLAVRVPVWLVLSALSLTRGHLAWSMKQAFMIRLLKYYLYLAVRSGARLRNVPTHLALIDNVDTKGLWVAPTPHLIVGEVKTWAANAGVECIRIPGYWQEPKDSNRPIGDKPRPGEKVIYHLHGGGYTTGSAHPTDPTGNIPRGIMQHAKSVTRAFSIEYRLSKGPPLFESADPFPAALLDAIAGYNYLVNEVGFAPENVILEGDSAGANLALALTRYLIENQSQTESPNVTLPPPPGELILCSPWSDIGDSDIVPGSSIYRNIPYDFIDITRHGTLTSKQNFLGSLGFAAANSNRYISPGSTAATMEPLSFKGFPRTFITAGDAEVLLDQILVLRDRMVADLGDGQVEYYEAPGGIHDYLVFTWHEPTRLETLRRIADWLA
ncbi:alpha/beta-hydrolase [Cristinia sonorae]|uniref:Alpha/beta-hydrolase n=1 Tax=Cristinia sonorae TaxID=1940300 RepID=A0A8K0UJY4_9AGAR|nr:alpha/beta-hydrolase [Cristinia sonorae]